MKKIAIVTGASRGLGRGTALILATEGNYSVYATARNADALDKLRFESLQNKKIKYDDLSIKIIVDKENKCIIVRDNGIGMSESELIENIGTIAKSGTSSFLEKLTGNKKKDSQLIGQFGVGFYSSFMVADKVEVLSKSALDSSSATLWKSDGGESYTLEKSDHSEHGTSTVSYTHLRAHET